MVTAFRDKSCTCLGSIVQPLLHFALLRSAFQHCEKYPKKARALKLQRLSFALPSLGSSGSYVGQIIYRSYFQIDNLDLNRYEMFVQDLYSTDPAQETCPRPYALSLNIRIVSTLIFRPNALRARAVSTLVFSPNVPDLFRDRAGTSNTTPNRQHGLDHTYSSGSY